jgi:hypothetical protein
LFITHAYADFTQPPYYTQQLAHAFLQLAAGRPASIWRLGRRQVLAFCLGRSASGPLPRSVPTAATMGVQRGTARGQRTRTASQPDTRGGAEGSGIFRTTKERRRQQRRRRQEQPQQPPAAGRALGAAAGAAGDVRGRCRGRCGRCGRCGRVGRWALNNGAIMALQKFRQSHQSSRLSIVEMSWFRSAFQPRPGGGGGGVAAMAGVEYSNIDEGAALLAGSRVFLPRT